jgi:hypothetical protein
MSSRKARPRWVRDVGIAALVAAVGALVTLAVTSLPKLFDDASPSGSVKIVQTLRNQTLDMFNGMATTMDEDSERGVTLDIARAGQDVPSDGCRLVWTWLDADGPTPVSDAALISQAAAHVRPDKSSCSTQARVWVPQSAGLDGYARVQVRVELYAGDHLLGSDVTEPIPLG